MNQPEIVNPGEEFLKLLASQSRKARRDFARRSPRRLRKQYFGDFSRGMRKWARMRPESLSRTA